MMLEGHKRNRALQAAEAAYKKAHEFAMQKTNTIIGYSLINWLTARVVRYLRGNLEQLDRQELKYWLDQSRQSIHDNDKHVGSFSNRYYACRIHFIAVFNWGAFG